MGKTMTTLADVTAGGRYRWLADGTIVAEQDLAAAAAADTAEGGPVAAVGAAIGEPPAPPEDPTRPARRQRTS